MPNEIFTQPTPFQIDYVELVRTPDDRAVIYVTYSDKLIGEFLVVVKKGLTPVITIENKKDMDAITERQEYTLQNVDMATILQSIPANYNGVIAERNLSPDATIYLLHYTEDLTLNCRIVTPIITATFLAIYCPVHPNIICELQKENEQYHLRLRKQKDLSFSAGGALSKKSSSESEFVATIDPDIVNLVNKAIEELLPIVNKFFARVIKGGKKLAVFTRIKLGEPLAQPTQTLTKLIDSTVADKITAEDVMKRERAARQKKLMQDKKEQQKGIEAEKSSLNGHHKNIAWICHTDKEHTAHQYLKSSYTRKIFG